MMDAKERLSEWDESKLIKFWSFFNGLFTLFLCIEWVAAIKLLGFMAKVFNENYGCTYKIFGGIDEKTN